MIEFEEESTISLGSAYGRGRGRDAEMADVRCFVSTSTSLPTLLTQTSQLMYMSEGGASEQSDQAPEFPSVPSVAGRDGPDIVPEMPQEAPTAVSPSAPAPAPVSDMYPAESRCPQEMAR